MKISHLFVILITVFMLIRIASIRIISTEYVYLSIQDSIQTSKYIESRDTNFQLSEKDIILSSSTVESNSSIKTDVINMFIGKMYANVIHINENIFEYATKVKYINIINPNITLASVSSIKITWDAEDEREYTVTYETDSDYVENITLLYPERGLCYITGLRINTDYEITIAPVIKENEKYYKANSYTQIIHTSNPEVIEEFEYIDGWTNCFASEKASGLTAMPSSGAIYGSKCDEITGTGIRRFENGDYCCAMGTHFGYCNDRFLIELENGIQFTTRICDSKGRGDVQDANGYGLWHNFGGSGKCIVEFIWDDGHLPKYVSTYGSWGGHNWNGLNLDANIKSIKKLANYDL